MKDHKIIWPLEDFKRLTRSADLVAGEWGKWLRGRPVRAD
jgi:hypothetical protein